MLMLIGLQAAATHLAIAFESLLHLELFRRLRRELSCVVCAW